MIKEKNIENAKPIVRLISSTKLPFATLASVWWTAKLTEKIPTVEEINNRTLIDPDYKQEVETLFLEIIEMLLPCSRFINFVFSIENVPISFREQLVRHKVGMEFWIQGARVTDMSTFSDSKQYRTPTNISNNPRLLKKYDETMANIQETYKEILDSGLLFEEARELLPMGSLHRLSFTCNIESLHNLVSKRTGWLLQGDLWFPILKGIIQELEENVSPVFRKFAHPPEVNMKGKYTGYKFKDLSYDRYIGITKLPVDPIFYFKEKKYIEERSGKPLKSIKQLEKEGLWDQSRVDEYTDFWGFNPSEL